MPEIGQTISHYRILEKVGQGGMGEVYLAEDLSLDRKVALKFLPDVFTGDPERMARFEREAKLLASLNHPNIAAIYGLEQADGKRFLIMEYVEGETLQARISKGALPLDEALAVCRQIAEGLEAAHEKGVIHRDLKPANVMITAEEKVKILDFGLAKALSDAPQSIDSSQSPTLTEAMTQPGVILGTAAYMSPEQAKGKSVDKRADIWAFGCILYECLTGKKVFEGETVTETLAAVIKEKPDWDSLLITTPQNVRIVLLKCLEKERDGRFRDAADLRILMLESLEIGRGAVPVIKQRSLLPWNVAVICLAGILLLGTLYIFQTQEEAPEMRFDVVTPATSERTSFALSPNGRHLVFVADDGDRQMLWLRSLDSVTPQPLPGTEGAANPFWSPDSYSVGFFAENKLKRIDISGKNLLELASVYGGWGGTWNDDNVIVFAPSYIEPLYRIPDSGAEKPVAITKLDVRQTGHTLPQFLSDGRHLLFYVYGQDQGVYFTSLDSTETKRVIGLESPVQYVPPSYLFFVRRDTLFVQSFDASRGNLSGDPILVAKSPVLDDRTSQSGFSVSETGVLAYRTGAGISRRLAWFDRDGNELGAFGTLDESGLLNPELSPNGRTLLVDRFIQGNQNVWLIDSRGIPTAITNDESSDTSPIFSNDGSQIFFSSNRNGIYDLYKIASNGSGHAELLLKAPHLNKFPFDCSKDGQFLLYVQVDEKTARRDIWVLPLKGEKEPFAFADKEFDETGAKFSPDGEWIAYQSDESRQYEVYVKKFPKGSRGKISNDGGMLPRWRHDGKELYYIDPDGKLMAVPIKLTDQTVEPGDPVVLFHPDIVHMPELNRAQYAVAQNGRFLINIEDKESAPAPITIVTNWTRILTK